MMKKSNLATEARIKRFMAEKTRKFPELSDTRSRRITVYQQGRIMDEVSYFLDSNKPLTSA